MLDAVKPQGCTNLKLRQLSRAVTRHYDAYVAPTGLKNSQYSLLSHVVLLGPLRPSDLAARMKTAHEAKRYDRLVLVAGPKMLGHLRDALDKQTAAAVSASLDKDLGEIPEHELAAHLTGVLSP